LTILLGIWIHPKKHDLNIQKIGNNWNNFYPEILIDKNGLESKGNGAIAESFSAHFASIGSNVTHGLGSNSAHSYKGYLLQSEDTSMFLTPVSLDEFKKIKKN
jgi:hypothetical protein